MQLASSARIPDGFMAAMRLGAEKPHQGVFRRNPALYQGFFAANSTTALGLQSGLFQNRVGSRCTGKERDTESGNDYFEARYYSSSMGRFMSPDWSAKEEPVPYAQMDDPQSLNLYSYVRNNPLTRVDADGHCAEDLCVVEGTSAAVVGAYIVGSAALVGIGKYFSTPSGQRSLSTFTSAASESIHSQVQTVKEKVTSIFNSDKKPGTRGKPDHQATAAEEADKIGGETEVRIPTPGGNKETRVGDAVATDADGKPTAVTQVIRPTPAGNIPLREQKAAQDIENATGVKPKLVPVRPLPQQ
jgi:RHS repeat-associated protein